jgi:hypothetical protein
VGDGVGVGLAVWAALARTVPAITINISVLFANSVRARLPKCAFMFYLQ